MSGSLPFWKVESIGNDFPLVHTDDLPANDSGFLERLAVQMCDRRFGVGGDGLLALGKTGEGLLEMRMYNPDGTEDFCGNGLRCAAHHASIQGWVQDSFVIRHLGRDVPVKLACGVIETTIAAASYEPSQVPLRPGSAPIFQGEIYWSPEETVQGSALTTGSTHVIVPTDVIPGDHEFLKLGPRIELFEQYPMRTSVIWRQVVAKDHLRIRIWERGVGETFGCGTGSSAAVADYLRREGRGGTVQVESPGGTLTVQMAAWDAPITVIGTAVEVYEGRFLLGNL